MKQILIGVATFLIVYAIFITYMQLNHFNHFNHIPDELMERYDEMKTHDQLMREWDEEDDTHQ